MFAGKNIWITGGSSGLGRELAGMLGKRGAKLGLVARDEGKLERVKAEIGGAVETAVGDVADAGAVEKAFGELAGRMGAPDILINSAGVIREGYFEDQAIEEFRRLMDINYFGTLHCVRAVLPMFKARGGGRIVNIASSGGLVGAFGYAAYCPSKFAVVGLTEVLRAELKPQGIKVHLVCPGEFNSPMVEGITEGRTPENKAVVQTIPVLETDEVARAVIAGLEHDDYLIIPGLMTRLTVGVGRTLPGLGRMIVDAKVNKHYRGPKR
jgi:3-dehydrosphinganine reductase